MCFIVCPFCGEDAEVFEDGSAICVDTLCLPENIGKFGTSFRIVECASGVAGSSETRIGVLIEVTELTNLEGPARFHE